MSTYRELDRDIVGEIWTSTEALDNLRSLCSFGSRFGGTPGEERAVEHMVQKFTDYGLDSAHAEEFTHLGWRRGTASLRVLAPREGDLDCISLPHVGSGTARGGLLYVGFGTPHEFDAAAGEMEGRVVMINSKSPSYFPRPIHRKEKINRAVRGGARAVIFMRWEPGLLPETGSTYHDREAPVPVISVSREVGEELLDMARQETAVDLEINVQNQMVPGARSWNVVGEIKGREYPDEIVLVGAHFDGHDIAVGAMDDGAGAAVVMESARALARHKDHLSRTVRFVCFALEEVGLQGSFNYTAAHSDEMDRIRFMLNLDGAGRASTRDLAVQGFTELIPYLRGLARDMNEPMTVDSNVVLFTDCFPFLARGVPSATVANLDDARGVRGFGHTPADTLDKVSLRDLQVSAIRVARLILRITGEEAWPGVRKSEDGIKEAIGPAGLEVLRMVGRYPFSS